jgi:hypothetical protein
MLIVGPSPAGGLLVVNAFNVARIEALPETEDSKNWYVRFDEALMGPLDRESAETVVRDLVAPFADALQTSTLFVEP